MEIPFAVLQKCSNLQRGQSEDHRATVEVKNSDGICTDARDSKHERVECMLTVSRSADDKISFSLNGIGDGPEHDNPASDSTNERAILSSLQFITEAIGSPGEVEPPVGDQSDLGLSAVNAGADETKCPVSNKGRNSKRRKSGRSPQNYTRTQIFGDAEPNDSIAGTMDGQSDNDKKPGSLELPSDAATGPGEEVKTESDQTSPALDNGMGIRRSSRKRKEKSMDDYVTESITPKKRIIVNTLSTDDDPDSVVNEYSVSLKVLEPESLDDLVGEELKWTKKKDHTVINLQLADAISQDATMSPEGDKPGIQGDFVEVATDGSNLGIVESGKSVTTELVKQYPCDLCGKIFKHRPNLVEHKRCVHKRQNPLVCPYCSRTVKHKDGLKAHCRKFHKGASLTEAQLAAASTDVVIALSLNVEGSLCKYCKVKFINKETLRDHAAAEHPEDVEYVKELETICAKPGVICSHCNKFFISQSSLRHHELRAHKKDIKAVECPFCLKVQAHHVACREHIRRIHKDVSIEDVRMEDFRIIDETGMLCLDADTLQSSPSRDDSKIAECDITQEEVPVACEGNQVAEESLPLDDAEATVESTISTESNQVAVVICPMCKSVFSDIQACKHHLKEAHDVLFADDVKEEGGDAQEVVLEGDGVEEVVGKMYEGIPPDGLEGENHAEEGHQMSLDETAMTLASLSAGFVGDNEVKVSETSNQDLKDAQKRAQCPICLKICNTTSSLVNHVRNNHANHPLNKTIRNKLSHHLKVKCGECGIVISTVSNYHRHMATVHGNLQPEPCPHCGKVYDSRFHMENHVKRVHSGTLLLCGLCNKLFKHKAGLDDHIKYMHQTQNRVPKFECKICNKKFIKKGYLSTHMKTHKEKAFQCNICQKFFSRKENLNQHKERLHYGSGKAFCCNHCQATFTSLWYLKTHIANTHTDQPRFTCNICSRSYMSNCSLSEHIRSVHLLRKDYKCTRCGSEFSRRRALVHHRKKVHLEEDADQLIAQEEENNPNKNEPDPDKSIIAAASTIIEPNVEVSQETFETDLHVQLKDAEIAPVVKIPDEKQDGEELVYEISGLEEGEYVISYADSGEVILMAAENGEATTQPETCTVDTATA